MPSMLVGLTSSFTTRKWMLVDKLKEWEMLQCKSFSGLRQTRAMICTLLHSTLWSLCIIPHHCFGWTMHIMHGLNGLNAHFIKTLTFCTSLYQHRMCPCRRLEVAWTGIRIRIVSTNHSRRQELRGVVSTRYCKTPSTTFTLPWGLTTKQSYRCIDIARSGLADSMRFACRRMSSLASPPRPSWPHCHRSPWPGAAASLPGERRTNGSKHANKKKQVITSHHTNLNQHQMQRQLLIQTHSPYHNHRSHMSLKLTGFEWFGLFTLLVEALD